MKALIVYESFFGNTEKIARAIGAGLQEAGRCEVVQVTAVAEVTDAAVQEAELIVVGSATRAFNPSPATASFIKSVPQAAVAGTKFAAFDTRVDIGTITSKFLLTLMRWFGYAAEKIDKKLTAKGAVRVAPPAWFCVTDSEGPLKAGEEERARGWLAPSL